MTTSNSLLSKKIIASAIKSNDYRAAFFELMVTVQHDRLCWIDALNKINDKKIEVVKEIAAARIECLGEDIDYIFKKIGEFENEW